MSENTRRGNYQCTSTAGERALAEARRERDEARAEVERLKTELADRYQNPPTMAKYEHMVAEVERMRALCAARPDSITVSDEPHIDNADGYRWLKKIADEGAKAKRGEGE